MRALLSEICGGPDTLVLREIADPKPQADQVRIKVEACGLNFPDVLMIEDKYQFTFARPFAPGIEVSGVIDALGPNVANLQVGQRVVAQLDNGGLAELALARADRCFPLPAEIAPEIAASALLTYATSLHALRDRGDLKAGETLLILGAAGGVGIAAIQLGKMMGATVVAAVSSEEKGATAKAAGADKVVIYPRDNVDGRTLAADFKNACTNGADVIYDAVGGPYAEPALRTLNRYGRYLVVGFAGGIPKLSLNLVLLKIIQVIGVFWGAAAEHDPAMARKTTEELFAHIAAGRLAPPPPRLYALNEAPAAISALRNRTAVGKLVVAPQQ